MSAQRSRSFAELFRRITNRRAALTIAAGTAATHIAEAAAQQGPNTQASKKRGPTGPTGATGPTGLEGLRGIRGPIGFTGPTGPRGLAALSVFRELQTPLVAGSANTATCACLPGEQLTGGGYWFSITGIRPIASMPQALADGTSRWVVIYENPDGLIGTASVWAVCIPNELLLQVSPTPVPTTTP